MARLYSFSYGLINFVRGAFIYLVRKFYWGGWSFSLVIGLMSSWGFVALFTIVPTIKAILKSHEFQRQVLNFMRHWQVLIWAEANFSFWIFRFFFVPIWGYTPSSCSSLGIMCDVDENFQDAWNFLLRYFCAGDLIGGRVLEILLSFFWNFITRIQVLLWRTNLLIRWHNI